MSEQLLRSAMAGDLASLDALWSAHQRWVAAVLLAHSGGSELDDLLQEVAMTVVQSLGRLDDPQAFRPWLRTIAINVARSAARRRIVRQRVSVSSASDRVADPRCVEATRRAEDRDQLDSVMRHIAEMRLELREPLLLRAVRGLTQREIAKTLGIPETTVETRLARARRRLRQQLNEPPTEHGRLLPNGCPERVTR